MKSGKCPRCESYEVYSAENIIGKQAVGIPITAWTIAPRVYYACTNCGYTEAYIIDQTKLEKIKEKWKKV